MNVLLLRRFNSTQIETLHEQCLVLEQDNDVRKYRQRFIELAMALDNVVEEIVFEKFINRLKP